MSFSLCAQLSPTQDVGYSTRKMIYNACERSWDTSITFLLKNGRCLPLFLCTPIQIWVFKSLLGENLTVQQTCDMWHVTCDMWCATCNVWHVTCDIMWHATCDMGYLESNTLTLRIISICTLSVKDSLSPILYMPSGT